MRLQTQLNPQLKQAALLCAMACCAAVALAQPAQTKPAVVPAPVAQPSTPTPPPAETDPNAIRVLLTPELETTLVAQMVGRIVTLNASLGSRVVKGRTVVAFDCGE